MLEGLKSPEQLAETHLSGQLRVAGISSRRTMQPPNLSLSTMVRSMLVTTDSIAADALAAVSSKAMAPALLNTEIILRVMTDFSMDW
jgi:hypothetical protein